MDQTNDLEVMELIDMEVTDAYTRFRKSNGGMPDHSEEPTLEQLSLLNALLQGARGLCSPGPFQVPALRI